MHHVIYAEGGGAAVIASLNYDARFSTRTHGGLGIRAGAGLAEGYVRVNPATGAEGWYGSSIKIIYPVGVNYLLVKEGSPHALEFGVNVVFVPKETIFDTWGDQETKARQIPSITIGYRRQPVIKGFLWKIGFNPFLQDGYFNLWLGAGLGYKF
jgi:hypothetical protein